MMPVRRRRPKRRIDDGQELEDWGEMFTHGGEGWAGTYTDLGFASEDEMRGAARAVWNRLGGLFLENWKPTLNFPTPWARRQFGRPRQCR